MAAAIPAIPLPASLFVLIVLGKFRLHRCYVTKDETTVIC